MPGTEAHGPVNRTLQTRNRLAARDGPACRWCGCLTVERSPDPDARDDTRTIDHLVPKSRGGSDEDHNHVIACWRCNADRGSLSVAEWLAVLDVRRRAAAGADGDDLVRTGRPSRYQFETFRS